MRRDEIGDPTERESGASFAPVRIGPGRRSMERTLVALVAVVGLVGLAIAKPWAGPAPDAPGAASATVRPAEGSAPSGAAFAPTRPAAGGPSDPAASPGTDLEHLADWWSVLGTDYGFVSGRLVGTEAPAPGVIVSTLTIWRQRPASEPLVPERLEPDCTPAAVVPVDTTVIGVTVPRREAPASISVRRQFVGGRSVEIPVRTMPLGDRGIWLLVPLRDDWRPGLYAVRIIGPSGARWLSVCVAARPAGTGGPILGPDATSTEAYEAAIRRLAGVEPPFRGGPRPGGARLAPSRSQPK